MVEIILNNEEIKKLNFDYLELLYNENIKYMDDVLILKNEKDTILVKAKRKYTFFAKNQIKTNYIHCWILGKGCFKQTKKGWINN